MKTFNVYIRESLEDSPTLVVSGLISPQYRLKGLNRGAKYYVSISVVEDDIEVMGQEKELYYGGVWTPLNLTSAKLYFDADDIKSASVINWVDRILGASVNAVSVNGRPYLREINGKKAVGFDTTRGLQTNDAGVTALMTSKNYGWFLAVATKDDVDTSASQKRISVFETGASGNVARLGIYAGDGNANNINKFAVGFRRLDSSDYEQFSTTQAFNTTAQSFIATADFSAREAKIYKNGAVNNTKSITATAGNTSATASNNFTVGGVNGGVSFNGRLGALVFGNTSLSTEDRQKLEGWSAHKYNLVDQLPLDHPYKTLMPTLPIFLLKPEVTAVWDDENSVLNLSWGDQAHVTYNVYVRDGETTTVFESEIIDNNLTISTLTLGKTYHISVGAVKSDVEKVSDEIEVFYGVRWTPHDSDCAVFMDADTVTASSPTSWTCSKTGGVYTKVSGSGTISLSTINGQKALDFQGGILSTQNADILDPIYSASNVYIFTVATKSVADTNTDDKILFNYNFRSGLANRFALYSNLTTANRWGIGGRKVSSSSFKSVVDTKANVTNANRMIFGDMNIDTDKISLYENGSLIGQTTMSFGGGVTSNDLANSNIGGYSHSGTNQHRGKIACIIVGKDMPTIEERQKLEGWSAHKYNLVDQLPLDHPYKEVAPCYKRWDITELEPYLSFYLTADSAVSDGSGRISSLDNLGNDSVSFVQSETSKMPLLQDNGIYFDGVNHQLQLTNRTLLKNKSLIWGALTFRILSASSTEKTIFIETNSNNETISSRLHISILNSTSVRIGFRPNKTDSLQSVTFNYVTNTVYMIYFAINLSTNKMELWLDGVKVSEITMTATVSQVENFDSSSNPFIGGSSGYANMNLYSFCMGAGYLPTQTEIDKIFGVMAHKFDLTDKLSPTHAYKTSHPKT